MAREFAKSFYKSKQWKMCREYVLMRDKYLCVECGEPAEEVHHIIHLNESNINNPNITMDPNNLKSLCKECHFNEHRGEHGIGRTREEEYEYEFDEFGMLVYKAPHSSEQR